MKPLTISRVAKAAGVHPETVRYYERLGLMPRPPRAGAYRVYAKEHIARLVFIKRSQGLGFSLKEIAGLLALRVQRGASCAEVKRRATQKLGDIDAKIKALKAIRGALTRLARACRGTGPQAECPLIDALERTPR